MTEVEPTPPAPAPLWAVALAYALGGAALVFTSELMWSLQFICESVPDRTVVDLFRDVAAFAVGAGAPVAAFWRWSPRTGAHRVVLGVLVSAGAGALWGIAYAVGKSWWVSADILGVAILIGVFVSAPLALIVALLLELGLWAARHAKG